MIFKIQDSLESLGPFGPVGLYGRGRYFGWLRFYDYNLGEGSFALRLFQDKYPLCRENGFNPRKTSIFVLYVYGILKDGQERI